MVALSALTGTSRVVLNVTPLSVMSLFHSTSAECSSAKMDLTSQELSVLAATHLASPAREASKLNVQVAEKE